MSDRPGASAADQHAPTVAQALWEAGDIRFDIDGLRVDDLTHQFLLHLHHELTLVLRTLVDAVSRAVKSAARWEPLTETPHRQSTEHSAQTQYRKRSRDSPVQCVVTWHDLVAHAERVAAVVADDPVIVDRGGDPDLLLCSTA